MPDPQTGLPYGIAPDGTLRPISAVNRGLTCDCRCPGCGRRLVAKKGTEVAHHFAHEADAECTSGYETVAHLLAKQIITESGWIDTPELIAVYRGESILVRRPMDVCTEPGGMAVCVALLP